ncbi:GNAT family N-acetyltransferase [Saccharicrinis fermentans]|uniref:Putative ribosomal N-acetyltransferase YdaF n=1 Tax=Saccharicrinis fermentans DSM 9555 = JCM 21142 TaxID=869213 RepID=W7XWC4_9BACT|nr:GNAT family protein [Saccharicrinis fermentans]GAF02565.1 putative ribosomal N-acetyltransferase YdaF [Saccharicrinis fermentans DSM 9555 = JCM 21142]
MESTEGVISKRIWVNNNICLRAIELSDAPIIFNTIDTQRAYLSEWLPFVRLTLDPQDTVNFVHTVMEAAQKGDEFVYVVELNGEFVGVINIRVLSSANRIVDIGYWLSEHFQKKGVISSAVVSLCNYAFDQLNMNRIQIRCGKGNMSSKKVPQRLGFTYEGIIREGEWVNDKYIDLESYSLLKKERHKLPVWLLNTSK